MGLHRFSVIPRVIPVLKEIISQIHFAEAQEAVSHMEAIDSPREVKQWVKRINKRMVGDVLERLNIHEET